MAPWLLRLLALGMITLLGNELLKSKKKFQVTSASNCDDRLRKFNEIITISGEKVEKLKRAHNTIREKVKYHFANNTNLPIPNFYIQGSYKTKTLIENINTICDVDLGVFFPSKPFAEIETLQLHIKKALIGHTTRGVSIKTNCVRLNYVSDFHIDLPIYYTDQKTGKTYFGARGYHWEPSEPKAFVQWFETSTNGKPQLIRIIRYLKAWADNARNRTGRKYPSGLALTLWAVQFYEPSKRDDVSLFNTCSAILQYLKDNFKGSWKATMPVEPFDNVLDRLSGSQKSFFYEELKATIETMADAVSADTKAGAIKKWKQIFGRRFI